MASKKRRQGMKKSPRAITTRYFTAVIAQNIFSRLSGYRRRFTEMVLFHCHAATTVALKFHRRQLFLADVPRIHFRSAAKNAFGFVIAGVTQMPRFIGNRTAILTCICHDVSPFIGRKTSSSATIFEEPLTLRVSSINFSIVFSSSNIRF